MTGKEPRQLPQGLTASEGSGPSRGAPPNLLQNSAMSHWVQKFRGLFHTAPCPMGDSTTQEQALSLRAEEDLGFLANLLASGRHPRAELSSAGGWAGSEGQSTAVVPDPLPDPGALGDATSSLLRDVVSNRLLAPDTLGEPADTPNYCLRRSCCAEVEGAWGTRHILQAVVTLHTAVLITYLGVWGPSVGFF